MAKLTSGTSVYGNISIATFVSAVGNVTGNYILGNGACLTGVITSVANINSGNSNVTIVAANSNISVGVGGTANVAVFATTGEFITGLLSVSGNVISNNVMATNIVNVASHTGSVVSVSANVTGGNLLTAGLISATGRIFAASGAVGTPGITFSADTGQDTGFYWISDGNIGVAQNGALRAFINTSGFSSNGIISASGAITGATTISATGNVDGGNLRTGGLISATGRIYSASGTAGGPGITFAADTSQDTGFYWVSDGNIGVATNGTLRATFLDTGLSVVANVTGGNILTAGLISATANIQGGNLRTAGLISATGNVTGNFFVGNGSALTGIGGTSISNGNSNVAVVAANSNVSVGVGGTSNIAVFATTGAYVSGIFSASGNILGGNITTGAGSGGNITGANVISCTNIKTTANTVANLPAAATVGAGARAFVTDATSTTFAATAVGGAANAVPVWTDGTTWKIG